MKKLCIKLNTSLCVQMRPASARELGNSYDKNGSTYPSSLRPQDAIYMRENNMSESDITSQSRFVTQNTEKLHKCCYIGWARAEG